MQNGKSKGYWVGQGGGEWVYGNSVLFANFFYKHIPA